MEKSQNVLPKFEELEYFAVEENFPINGKIHHFSNLKKKSDFLLSMPVSMPIFRPNGEGGNFPIKSDELEHLHKVKIFR